MIIEALVSVAMFIAGLASGYLLGERTMKAIHRRQDRHNAEQLADRLGVRREWLLDGRGSMYDDPDRAHDPVMERWLDRIRDNLKDDDLVSTQRGK